MKQSLIYRSLIEAFGAFSISFTALNISNLSSSVLEQSLLIGILVATLIHAFGRITGAHFNPIVSLLLIKKANTFNLETISYTAFQIFGALCISFLSSIALKNDFEKSYDFYSLELSHIIPEFIFTFLFLFLILSWSNEGKLCPFSQPFTGIVVGLGLASILCLSSLFGDATLNPAVSLSLAIQGCNPDFLNQIIGQILALILAKKYFFSIYF